MKTMFSIVVIVDVEKERKLNDKNAIKERGENRREKKKTKKNS